MNEPIKLTDRSSPQTDAFYSVQCPCGKAGCIIAPGPHEAREHARRLEQKLDAAVEALEAMNLASYDLQKSAPNEVWSAFHQAYKDARAALTAIKETK